MVDWKVMPEYVAHAATLQSRASLFKMVTMQNFEVNASRIPVRDPEFIIMFHLVDMALLRIV
jgi:hypothetical protein